MELIWCFLLISDESQDKTEAKRGTVRASTALQGLEAHPPGVSATDAMLLLASRVSGVWVFFLLENIFLPPA